MVNACRLSVNPERKVTPQMSISTSSAAVQIHEALLSNETFPDALIQTMSIDEAYDVQFELLDLRQAKGDEHAGWKVGLTSKAMQEQQGVHEPCLGHLVRDGHDKNKHAGTWRDDVSIINPMLMMAQHDTLSYSDSSPVLWSLNFTYEAIEYGNNWRTNTTGETGAPLPSGPGPL